MPRFAVNTVVSADDSQRDIRRIFKLYGAVRFAFLNENSRAAVVFDLLKRRIRLELPLPDRSEFDLTETGNKRSAEKGDLAHDKAINQRWRALALVIRAKLEAVEIGITSFEDEFLAFVVLPATNQTFGEWAKPQLDQAIEESRLPPMLNS